MVQAWSIPSANRRSLSPVDASNPGPGQYQRNDIDILAATSTTLGCIHFKRTNPAFSIGREKRKSMQMTEAPGIGTYNLFNHVALRRAPNYSFGVKNQFNSIIAYSPGPSDYKKEVYNNHNRFPAYSFASGRESTSVASARRQIQQINEDSKNYTRPSSTNGDKKTDRDSYRGSTTKEFTTEADKSTIQGDKPTVETQDTNMIATSRSQGGPRSGLEVNLTQNTPRRQSGENKLLFRKSGPHSSRQTSPGNRVPALDLSNLRTSKNKGSHNSSYADVSSGRGTMDSKTQGFWVQDPSQTKNFLWKISESPGPAFYEPNYNTIRNQSVTPVIGRNPRKFHSESISIEAPGPASYSPNPSKMEVKHSFPQSQRLSSRESKGGQSSPGPADYIIKPMFADVPKYLMNKQ